MKHLFIITVLSCIMSNHFTCYGQDNTALLTLAIEKSEAAKDVAEMKQARAGFERLASINSTDWLPAYYLILTDIELSFRVESKEEKEQYLKDAESHMDTFKKLKISDTKANSEINTLKGYWCFAQMALDPATNGPRYSGLIINHYSTALKQNPDNPRAIKLNAHFRKNMASFMGSTYAELESDLEKAEELFGKEDKKAVFPHWGYNRNY